MSSTILQHKVILYIYIHVYYVHLNASLKEPSRGRIHPAFNGGWNPKLGGKMTLPETKSSHMKMVVGRWGFFFVWGGGCCGCCFYLLVWNFRRIQKQQLFLVISIKKENIFEMPLILTTRYTRVPTITAKSQIKCQLVWGGDKRCTNARGSTGGDFLSWLHFNRC